VLIIAGILMSAAGASSFRKAGTPVIPFETSTALVLGGLYRFTRNPMYLGMTIALLGAAVLFGTLGAFLPLPLFVWVIQTRFIAGEERFLEEIFGQQYLAYKRRVRRWL
jgi:protein-S-isoprenylcysteine O-methyltransferase Ste14